MEVSYYCEGDLEDNCFNDIGILSSQFSEANQVSDSLAMQGVDLDIIKIF